MAIEALIDQAALYLSQADALLICGGAGMGVDSGLPDFRGNDGFWRAYPALSRARLDFERAATPQHFVEAPRRAWGFYGHRLSLYRQTRPHAAFAKLLDWGQRLPGGYFVNTSNVDGQFQLAGFDPARICEVHGSLSHLQCLARCHGDVWSAEHFQPEVDVDNCKLTSALPVCAHCGGTARPNVLMFGDWSWIDSITAQQRDRRDRWLAQQRRLVVIEIGAGIDLPSIRRFTERVCASQGSKAIRINPRAPYLSPALGVGLPLGAVDAIHRIAARLDEQDITRAPSMPPGEPGRPPASD